MCHSMLAIFMLMFSGISFAQANALEITKQGSTWSADVPVQNGSYGNCHVFKLEYIDTYEGFPQSIEYKLIVTGPKPGCTQEALIYTVSMDLDNNVPRRGDFKVVIHLPDRTSVSKTVTNN